MKLSGKVAFITGGARGIGKAVAIAYAREGAKLALCARTAAELDQTVGEIRALQAEAAGWVCDVSLEDSAQEFIDKAFKKFGRADILVNNAGVMTRPVPMIELEVKKWDYTIAVNLRGPFLITRAVLPTMIKQKSGSIINVSSMIGRGAYANFLAYATSKWGLEGFTQTLAAEALGSNIRVNSVEPGYVATKLTGFHGSKPESVTDVFVYLASDESKGVSGKMLSSSEMEVASTITNRQTWDVRHCAALVIPFRADGNIDIARIGKLRQSLVKTGTAGRRNIRRAEINRVCRHGHSRPSHGINHPDVFCGFNTTIEHPAFEEPLIGLPRDQLM